MAKRNSIPLQIDLIFGKMKRRDSKHAKSVQQSNCRYQYERKEEARGFINIYFQEDQNRGEK